MLAGRASLVLKLGVGPDKSIEIYEKWSYTDPVCTCNGLLKTLYQGFGNYDHYMEWSKINNKTNYSNECYLRAIPIALQERNYEEFDNFFNKIVSECLISNPNMLCFNWKT